MLVDNGKLYELIVNVEKMEILPVKREEWEVEIEMNNKFVENVSFSEHLNSLFS